MPDSNGSQLPSTVDTSVTQCVRTLDVYPLAPLHKSHSTASHSSRNSRLSIYLTGSRTPSRKIAAAACNSSPSSPPPALKSPVTEADYLLCPQEVHSRAQKVLTAQVRSLLEARLQERLRQARAAQARWEEDHRPSQPPAALRSPCAPPLDTAEERVVSTGVSLEAIVEANAPEPLTSTHPSSEEVWAPLTIQRIPTQGISASGAAMSRPSSAPRSSLESSSETSDNANPYSSVDLVRVHRLKGIPKHNRGLYSGLVNRCFTTRSGHYTVGRDSDEIGRVRSGVSGFLLGTKRHSDAHLFPPSRLTMRSLFTDNEIIFQWAEDNDSEYAVFEDEEPLFPPRYGRRVSHTFSGNDSLLVRALKRMLEKAYGKQMSVEQRSEALRLLREHRESQHRRRGDHPSSGLEKRGGGHQVPSISDDMMNLERYIQEIAKTGSFADADELLERIAQSNTESRSGLSPSSKHHVTVVQDLSPTIVETDKIDHLRKHLAAAMPPKLGDHLINPAAYGDLSLSNKGSGQSHVVGSEDDTKLEESLTPYSPDRTKSPGEAAAFRHKRQTRVAFVDLSEEVEYDGPTELSGTITLDRRPKTSTRVKRVTSAEGDAQSGGQTTSVESVDTSSSMSGLASTSTDPGYCYAEGNVDTNSTRPRVTSSRGSSGKKTTDRKSSPILGVDVGGVTLLSPKKRNASPILGRASPISEKSSSNDLLEMSPTDSAEIDELDNFLMLFPEQKNHVKLRRTAKSILDGVEDMWDDKMKEFLLPSFMPSIRDNLRMDNFNATGSDDAPGLADGNMIHDDDDDDDTFTGFCVSDDVLVEKFHREAEEEFDTLVAQRDALRTELEEQIQLLNDFVEDAHYLSVGQSRSGLTAEQYASALTRNVYNYSVTHRLHMSRALEGAAEGDLEKNDAETDVEGAADSFLDRFWKQRSSTVDVGCQVSDMDLCYVDPAVRSTEEKLEDMLLHEKALLGAVRLTTVAVANAMTFHASLEMESTCRECFYVFDKPRTLWPCGHTFCLACLSNMYNNAGELICSECGSICETGYTPNVAIEFISNYQTLCRTSETATDVENGGVIIEEKSQTVESVLRNLMNELLAAQSTWSLSHAA